MPSSSSPTPANPGADSVRHRIEALIQQISAEPNNQAPLLQLGHLYAQVWIKNQDPQAILRVVNCMKRAIDLESGQNTAQFRQLLSGIAKQAAALKRDEVVVQFRELNAQLNAKVETLRDKKNPIAPTIQEQQTSAPPAETSPTEEAPPPPPPPPPSPSAPKAAPEPAPEEEIEEDDSAFSTPEISMDIPLPKKPTHEPKPAPAPVETQESDFDTAFQKDEVSIETVSTEVTPEEIKAEIKAEALTTAREKAEIDPLFEDEQVGEIIQTYARLNEVRVKRYIIERLIEKIEDWKIEPVLAVAAMESDKQTFRFIMRSLLKGNRSLICQQINLENYSPDLCQVAIVILGDLGLRSALPKLKQALDIEDPIVRCVALHGIGRSGKAAARLIHTLVDTTHRDPDPNVRQAAAKALATMNMEEAFDALDTQSRKTHLEAAVQNVLEEMRQRFDPNDTKGAQRLAKEKGTSIAPKSIEKDKKKASKPGQGQKTGGNKTALYVIIGILVLAGLGWTYREQLTKMWGSATASPDDIYSGANPPSQTGLPPPTPTPVP